MPDLIADFKAARRASTPLIGIRTPDPASTVEAIKVSFNGSAPPMIGWDCNTGLYGLNDEGDMACDAISGGEDLAMTTGNPTEMLRYVSKLPERSVLFAHHLAAFLETQDTSAKVVLAQGIWSLRDAFKQNKRTLVMLDPDFSFPPLLAGDVIILDDPLPDDARLEEIVTSLFMAVGVEATTDLVAQAVDAVSGLSAFMAEQSVAMSLTRDGLDMERLWECKVNAINSRKGLTVMPNIGGLSNLVGHENLKTFLRREIGCRSGLRCVLFLDEIEKAMGGAGTDLSGVKTDLHGVLLRWLSDNRIRAIMLVGVPGTGKSAIARAAASEAGALCVACDVAGMQESLVGASGANARMALATVDAIAKGDVLVIATSNNIASLSPELRRRFKRGTFFFDLPTTEENLAIWNFYCAKYSLTNCGIDIPSSEGWTGAEIEQCCELAADHGCTLEAAAAYVVPMATAAPEMINRLRSEASGAYISTNAPGPYRKPVERAVTAPTRRLMDE